MAAIAPDRRSFAWLLLLAAVAMPLHADRAADVRAQVTSMASALASGNPTDALSSFDKHMPDFDKISAYFAALTDSYDIVNELEITDEDDQEKETRLRANWTLQLSDKSNNSNVRRTFEVTILLKPSKSKWIIASFTPIEMFNPQVPAK